MFGNYAVAINDHIWMVIQALAEMSPRMKCASSCHEGVYLKIQISINNWHINVRENIMLRTFRWHQTLYQVTLMVKFHFLVIHYKLWIILITRHIGEQKTLNNHQHSTRARINTRHFACSTPCVPTSTLRVLSINH